MLIVNHSKIKTYYRPCTLGESMCGLEIRVQQGKILSITGDKDDPFSQGHMCPKAMALREIHEDPDRLRHPVKRAGNKWEPVSWKNALDETARKIRSIQKKYGDNAAAVYMGTPTAFNYGFLLFMLPFIKALHTKNRFSTTSVDQLPLMVAAYLMFGHQALLPVPDLDRTDFFLIIGSNPLVSMGSMMSAGNIRKKLKAVLHSGGKIVVIDPRRTRTAQLASRHHFIRPGTDALLLLAMINVIFEENRDAMHRMKALCNGHDLLRDMADRFPPERVEKITGIKAEDIRRLAREFSGAKTAACYGRMGTCGQEFGTVTSWLIYSLNIITENIDRPGSLMFSRPAVDLVDFTGKTGQGGHLARWHSRVRGLPEFSGELPAVALADEILAPGDGQVRTLITIAGNPALSSPNSARTEKALKSLDFMVSMDFYINETTRHADIILPPVSHLESSQYHLACLSLAVRNTVKYGKPVFQKKKGAKADWEIVRELTRRLEESPFKRMMAKFTSPDMLLGLLMRMGPYGAKFNPLSHGLTLGRVKKKPHGIDLGPLMPCLPGRLYTPDKKIQLAPEQMVDDLNRLEEKFFAASNIKSDVKPDSKDNNYDMLLIGRRQLKAMNWWTHNYPCLMKGKLACTAWMNPEDARKRGIHESDIIIVSSLNGQIKLPVELTRNIMPGVISIPHGWGHDRPQTRLSVARQKPGVCLNDITSHESVDKICGMAALNGVRVKVSPDHDHIPKSDAAFS